MTAAFAVAAAVAVLAIVALVVMARRSDNRVAAERSHADELDAELRAAGEARAQAERRLQQDQRALGAAVQRADLSERRATDAEGRLAAADTLWDLERIRLEREWREVTGTPAPLPQPWDGTIRAAVAVELEIIREVIGIPTRLEPPGAATPRLSADRNGSRGGPDPIATLGTARLTGEILRSLARVSEEMVVSVDPDGSVTVTVATEGAPPGPDLGRLTETAAALGDDLSVRLIAGGIEARLRLPAPAP